MMASLKQPQIDQKTQDCVHGYIKICQKLLPDDNIYYNIPELVIHWILLFYFIGEEFDTERSHKEYIISDDNRIMRCRKDENVTYLIYGMAYLKNAVSEGIHKWTFKCLNVNNDDWFDAIGVWKTKATSMDEHIRVDDFDDNQGYGWTFNYQEITTVAGSFSRHIRYGKRKCLTGDIIDMILDLEKLEIRFIVNEEDWGVAFQNIEKTEYKAVVSANIELDAIELISYQWIK